MNFKKILILALCSICIECHANNKDIDKLLMSRLKAGITNQQQFLAEKSLCKSSVDLEDCQLFLADHYIYEKNDYDSAFHLLQAPSESNDAYVRLWSNKRLAEMYQFGLAKKIPANDEKAKIHLERAAKLGEPLAAHNLAAIFAKRARQVMNSTRSFKGAEQDYLLSYAWLRVAILLGQKRMENSAGQTIDPTTRVNEIKSILPYFSSVKTAEDLTKKLCNATVNCKYVP